MDRTNRSTKKRHTKPCKYFQSGTCTLTADACDFAHVQTFPSPSYAYCDQPGCQMRPGPQPVSDPIEHYYLKSPTAAPMVPYPLQIGVGYPSPTIYSPYSPDASSSPIAPFPVSFHPGGPGVILPAVSSESSGIDSPVTSSEDAESSTDEVVFSDASTGLGSYHQQRHPQGWRPQQQPQNPPMPPVPPLAMPYQSPNSSGFAMFSPTKEGPKLKSRSRSLGPSKKKIAKYKTKQCRFWTPERGCPNGNECTFLHGDEINGKMKLLPEPKHALPPRPLTMQEANAKKGYYPISWRVIGGGVKMGVEQEQGNEEDVVTGLETMNMGEGGEDVPPARRRRVRSNSMGSTPMGGTNTWLPTFSAET